MDNRTYRADDRLNAFNDQDEAWGPLLFLRPSRHQTMSVPRVLAITGLLGSFYGMLGNVVLGLLARGGGSTGKPSVVMMPLLLTAVYFTCAQISLVAAWNRRARLLSRQLSWAELTRRPTPPRDDEEQAE